MRNGYQPERKLLTGLGKVDIQFPKTRDKACQGRHFRSHILPPYQAHPKRRQRVAVAVSQEYISTRDMAEAVTALLGEDAPKLSPSTLSRVKQSWLDDYKSWRQCDLNKKYVYIRICGKSMHFICRVFMPFNINHALGYREQIVAISGSDHFSN